MPWLFCFRILVAEQTVRCFVLLDLRETANGRIEAIVGVVVVALADLTQQNSTRARFNLEIVIHILLDMDALARCELHLRPGRDSISSAIAMDSHVGFTVDGLVRQAVVNANEDVSAATVDDVLGLVPVEMIRGILPLLYIEQLLGVDLRILVLHRAVAVADGDERHTDLVKIAEAVIGDVPAEHTVADFVIFVSLGFPFFRCKVAERWKIAVLLRTHGFQFLQSLVYF